MEYNWSDEKAAEEPEPEPSVDAARVRLMPAVMLLVEQLDRWHTVRAHGKRGAAKRFAGRNVPRPRPRGEGLVPRQQPRVLRLVPSPEDLGEDLSRSPGALVPDLRNRRLRQRRQGRRARGGREGGAHDDDDSRSRSHHDHDRRT